MNNKVVARFADGRVVKGTTADFNPTKDAFHVTEHDAAPDAQPILVLTQQLKALFFVKDFAGDSSRDKTAASTAPRPALGRKIKVVFKDGEVLVGTTAGYQPGRTGFFIEPEDAGTNEERCFVITQAAEEITLL
jgi:hypothetical protein